MADNQITYEDAGNLLYSQVYAPVFFQKLAEFGIQPQNEAQAESLLRQAQVIRQARAAEMTKQAAEHGDPLLLAEQRLMEKLAQVNGQPPVNASAINKYAAEVARARPELAEAAIAYQNGYAKALLAEQAQ